MTKHKSKTNFSAKGISRRKMLQNLGISGSVALLAPFAVRESVAALTALTDGGTFPTSPRILEPFTDRLPIPTPLASSDPSTWRDPNGRPCPPDPVCNSTVASTTPGGRGVPHQIWQNPVHYYRIQLRTAQHAWTSSRVLRRDFQIQNGVPVLTGGTSEVPSLPTSTISGFNGTFPGPLIDAWYGRPCLVRFENLLTPDDGTDFGAPSFLTHLHNGHTACESDGNPHFNPVGYDSFYLNGQGPAGPNWYCDNLYLNYPAGGFDSEKQAFMWFHDHRMDHTSSNVYKGMVGLYCVHDDDHDCSSEVLGYRLPCEKYDVPLAFYDCRLDDGVTPHAGIETRLGQDSVLRQDGQPHPENWGKAFFGKYPGPGFIGDVFTVNGKAWPVMRVHPRKYRFRFLDCSISRWYRFSLMKGNVVDGAPIGEQWMLDPNSAQQCMRFTQIAAEGGLLPSPIVRDAFTIAPAKRKEMIVDFSRYMDGSPTKVGDVVYLVTTLKWTDGKKPEESTTSGWIVPILKFVITGGLFERDNSIVPPILRLNPVVPPDLTGVPRRTFELQSGGGGWQINGRFFDPFTPLAQVTQGVPEIWEIRNGGGGWVHPMHLHMEEHHVIRRIGNSVWYDDHPDDHSKEDVIALAPGEEVHVYRNFRTFRGPYVAHCHNLAHEDNAMMFGWSIL